jgi:hypothetical protein
MGELGRPMPNRNVLHAATPTDDDLRRHYGIHPQFEPEPPKTADAAAAERVERVERPDEPPGGPATLAANTTPRTPTGTR